MRKCLLWLKYQKTASAWHQHSWENSRFKLVFQVEVGDWVIFSLLPFYLPTTLFLGLLLSWAISCVYCLSFLWRLGVHVETSREVGILQRGLHQHDFGARFLTWRPLSKLTVFSLFVGQTASAFISGFHLLLLPLYLECIVYSLSAHK